MTRAHHVFSGERPSGATLPSSPSLGEGQLTSLQTQQLLRYVGWTGSSEEGTGMDTGNFKLAEK